MPRVKGSKVIFCKNCRGRVVGMPGEHRLCPYCETVNIIPKKPAKGKKQ